MKEHVGEGVFPSFEKGTRVSAVEPCKQYPFWSSCKIGMYSTYVPNTYIENGMLNQAYNPTELVVAAQEQVTLWKVVFDWAYVQNSQGDMGWLPFQILYCA